MAGEDDKKTATVPLGVPMRAMLPPGNHRRPRVPAIDLDDLDKRARSENGEPAAVLFETSPIDVPRARPVIDQLEPSEAAEIRQCLDRAAAIYQAGFERFQFVRNSGDPITVTEAETPPFPPSRAFTVWTDGSNQPTPPTDDEKTEQETNGGPDSGQDTAPGASGQHDVEANGSTDRPEADSGEETEAGEIDQLTDDQQAAFEAALAASTPTT